MESRPEDAINPSLDPRLDAINAQRAEALADVIRSMFLNQDPDPDQERATAGQNLNPDRPHAQDQVKCPSIVSYAKRKSRRISTDSKRIVVEGREPLENAISAELRCSDTLNNKTNISYIIKCLTISNTDLCYLKIMNNNISDLKKDNKKIHTELKHVCDKLDGLKDF